MIKSGDMFGEYRVVKLLGKGGMGEVWLLQIEERREFYAVKILDLEMAAKDREFQRRFLREAELAMSIRHRNLIEVFDVGKDPETGLCYILMEYVSGGTLSDLIHKKGSLPICDAVKIVYHVADVLNCIAKHGIVHRDIKPDNILFDKDGKVKIADLGIARRSLDQHTMTMTQTGVVIGTPAYMAPEQMLDSHHVDIRADIYSLGIVFYEMLAGKRPNEGDTVIQLLAKAMRGEQIPDVRTMRPEVSATLAELLNLMCSIDVGSRIATPYEVMVRISDIVHGKSFVVRHKFLRRKLKNKILWITFFSTTLVVGVVWYIVFSYYNSKAVKPDCYDSLKKTSVALSVKQIPRATNITESSTVNIKFANNKTTAIQQQVNLVVNDLEKSSISSMSKLKDKNVVDDNPAKLPIGSMPKVGLLVAYDYNDGAAINCGYGRATVNRNDVIYRDRVAVFDGEYKFRLGEDVVLPDFNYDRFTVAFSFKPEKADSLLRIGSEGCPALRMDISSRKGGVLSVRFSDRRIDDIDYDSVSIGAWNWVVCSVDVSKRLALVSVNGKPWVERALPSDFYWRIPSAKGDLNRRLHFGDSNRGARFKGEIDDLYVYDRALSKEEMLNIVRRISVKDIVSPCASAGAGLKVLEPKLMPGKWVLVYSSESSQYWNATISMHDITLPVRVDDKGILVSPIHRDVDLAFPIVDATGAEKHIYAIGIPPDGVGGFIPPGSGSAKTVKLPKTLKVLYLGAFGVSDKHDLKEILLPESLELIESRAFHSCKGLEAIVIPRNVRKIGSRSFRDCTSLKKVEIKGECVMVAADAFSGLTPVRAKMPNTSWTTGPTLIEVKVDSSFEYAKYGRINQPIFSSSLGDIKFGKTYKCGGFGGLSIDGCEFLGKKVDVRFYTIGPGLLGGCSLMWSKKVDRKGNPDDVERAVKSLLSVINKKLGGSVAPPKMLLKDQWPKYGYKGMFFDNYNTIKPIGSSKTEFNGYIVKISIYGGSNDENFLAIIDIVDSYMFKAWGTPIPEAIDTQRNTSRLSRRF